MYACRRKGEEYLAWTHFTGGRQQQVSSFTAERSSSSADRLQSTPELASDQKQRAELKQELSDYYTGSLSLTHSSGRDQMF